MDSVSWFLCAINDKYLPTKGFPNSVTESFVNIHRRVFPSAALDIDLTIEMRNVRQLVHIQDVVTGLEDRKTEPQTSLTLSLDDRRAIAECREAVTSASRELKVN
jgi:hypothetical protein